MIPINHTGDNGWLTMNWMDEERLLPPQLPSTALHQLAHVNEGTDDAGFLSASRKLHRRMPRTKYPGMVEPKWRALSKSTDHTTSTAASYGGGDTRRLPLELSSFLSQSSLRGCFIVTMEIQVHSVLLPCNRVGRWVGRWVSETQSRYSVDQNCDSER